MDPTQTPAPPWPRARCEGDEPRLDPPVIGAVLREGRRRMRWSQRELAKRAGLPKGTVADLETGSRDPRLSTVLAALGAVGILLVAHADPAVAPSPLGPAIQLTPDLRTPSGRRYPAHLTHYEIGRVTMEWICRYGWPAEDATVWSYRLAMRPRELEQAWVAQQAAAAQARRDRYAERCAQRQAVFKQQAAARAGPRRAAEDVGLCCEECEECELRVGVARCPVPFEPPEPASAGDLDGGGSHVMSEYQEGGRRLIDRVLAPEFLAGLVGLSLEDVRKRRSEAEQEEVDLSYARRLLQGRLDILNAEVARRRGTPGSPDLGTPKSDQELVAELAPVLADSEPRVDQGLGRFISAEPSRIGEHRREAEAAVADISVADLHDVDDDELRAVVLRLAELERRTSDDRLRVQAVMDACTDEIARRYRDGEANVESALGLS